MESHSVVNARFSYHAIFSDICKTRFNHLVRRLFLTTTVLQAVAVQLLTNAFASPLESALLVVPKMLALYVAALLIIITRKNYLHVRSLGYSTVSTQALGQIFLFRFTVYQLIFSVSSFATALAIGDCLGLSSGSPVAYNGSLYGQFYRLYVWLLIPTIYNLQHNLFDLDKLSFNFVRQFQPPQTYIASNLTKMVFKSLFLSGLLTVLSPFAFALLAPVWYTGILSALKLAVLSFLVILHFEFVNISFDAHLSIGCLHKGKPISSLSSTPIETLVSGLASKKPFTKLTAFQELSYRATLLDPSLRLPIYENSHRGTNMWPVIMKECLAVIQETNETVGKYLTTVERTLQGTSKHERLNPTPEFSNEPLFGNSPSLSKRGFRDDHNLNSDVVPNGMGYRTMPLRDENIFLNKYDRLKRNDINSAIYRDEFLSPRYIDSQHSVNDTIFTHNTKISKLISLISNRLQRVMTNFFFPSTLPIDGIMGNKMQLSVFEAWCLSKSRQAEKLVPLSICHAESVVSLMGFLINGLEESPRGHVVASVGDVLKQLVRSVGILGRFSDWNPDVQRKSGTTNKEDDNSLDVISILYELSINAFLEIVLKYGVLLNDVHLDDDVVKLSKWVLDMCDA
ncbi:Ndc1p KNAG_0B03420 [Huiozyma naganishii CBS 8797]|uniref:Nucleoporin NDC1 n=1 Tax=Huiozyma naganishii (strain ATCC MYA-139 / BCRC 22969 / CBS 8797 / KCTC 17520 / NBRC 10181 / NCYC 3082 / Yp74L-3) TaxID=1071383 RepID=J7S3L1_HUIN7|nr:hypothetical protein KNAG_0B03420 [Kazachstania naganishii CBS 8797]CCK68784.1 hypothetical protein KNAG_0B03420 [Kazachstania naganishii CBS 8797]